MNAPSNAVPDTQATAPATLSPTRPLYWSVRRELWENKSIYAAPLIGAAVVLIGFLIGMGHFVDGMRALPGLDPAKQVAVITQPYSIAASIIILLSFIVGAFYCLDALHGERRDRSILFWKSLPVSDLTTVLSKACIPFVILPPLVFAIVILLQLVLLLLSTVILAASGIDSTPLWTQLPLGRMTVIMFYGVTAHVLWFAPIYGWFLLVSGWVKRSPFLWAVLPPLALIALEKVAFDTTHVAALLKYRFAGAMVEGFSGTGRHGGMILSLEQLEPIKFLSSPGLWTGLLVAAAFIAAAVRLRRYREPI